MRSIIGTVIISAALLCAISAGAAGASVIVDRVVAVVNDDIITMSDLQREESLKKTGVSMDARLLLEDMIDRKLQMAAAKQAGMDVSDKELADALADIMKRNSLSAAQFEAALGKEGLTLEQYKTELREQMTMSRMFNKYVRSGLSVDDAEVRAYYERNRKAYALPEEIRVRQLYFRIPDRATPAEDAAVKAQAEAALLRARKGADFAGLVRELSDRGSAAGGDLGFLRRGDLLSEIEEAARTLKPGEFAGPLRSEGGYHIIRLEETRTPVKPFEKVKEEISNELFQQKLDNTYRSWLQTLRNDSHIENRL